MPRALRAALLVCLCLPAASAATQLFSFSGTIDQTVTDTENFLDASVAPTVSVSGTYEVDAASGSGASPFTVGAAHLIFGLGNYGFDQNVDPHSILLINNTGPPGFGIDLWQSGSFIVSDLTTDPPGGTNHSGNFGGYAARIEFFVNDTPQTSKFDGTESAPMVPDDTTGWTAVRLLLDSLDGSSSPDGRVQVQVNITNWALVPEPSTSALLALGLVALALRARWHGWVR